MHRNASVTAHAVDRRAAPVIAVCVLLSLGLAAPAQAQRIVPETPPPAGGAAGVGGGAGLIAPLPTLPPAMHAPVLAPPLAAPQAAPPVAVPAAPAPAAPARIVRFRCELAPQEETCREAGVGDGGGDDNACSCARDYCTTSPAGTRVCEKLQ